MTIEHKNIPDINLHEPKGVASASSKDVYVADGAGSGAWQQISRMGWWDYNDLTTQSSPITISGADIVLTNDGAGTNTNDTYALSGVADIWNTSTNRFDFSGLSVGDTVDIRVDLEVTTTTTNVDFTLELEANLSPGTPFTIPFFNQKNFKAAATHQVSEQITIYIGSTDVRDNPARFIANSSNTATTVTVNGWFIRVIKRGEF